MGCKMTSLVMKGLEDHRPQGSPPRLRHDYQFLGKMAQPQLHTGDMQLGPTTRIGCVMHRLVVDPDAGGRARGRELVDGDPGEDLVGSPGVLVCPIVELFVDPGE